MKHFLIDITYKVDISKIEEVLAEHRSFLQIGYDNNMLLCSGPKNPRDGGLIIAKSESREELENFFNKDPYKINDCADYKFTEFTPVKSQEFMKEWI